MTTWTTPHMSLHVIVLLYVLSGCRAAVRLSMLGPDSDGAPRLSDSAVRLSDYRYVLSDCQRKCCQRCQAVGPTVRRCPGFAVRLSDQGSASRGRLVRVRRGRGPAREWISGRRRGPCAAAVSIKSKIEGLQNLARPGSSRRGSPELCPFLVDVLVPAVVHVLRAAAPTLQPRLRRVLRHEVNAWQEENRCRVRRPAGARRQRDAATKKERAVRRVWAHPRRRLCTCRPRQAQPSPRRPWPR